jgi:glutamate synthase (NADPH/NADH) small chain
MPSSCPKCRRVLEEDEICCAQVRYTWRCKSCFKLTTGFAIPYGKCFMCGGELEVIPGRELGDTMRFRAIRDAVQFELNSFHFYKLARDHAHTPEQKAVLERLYEAELDHLHELEEKYHAHLDREVVELSADEQKLLSNWLFQGIRVNEDSGVADLYRLALELERRTRDHFHKLAADLPPGLEKELCEELAAEEEEHVAMLETELEQIS